MKTNLLSLMALLLFVMGYSQTFTATDSYGNVLQYSVLSASTVSLTTGSTINNTNVDIPATVSNGGVTYSVTTIGYGAMNNKSISSVNIPNSVINIEQSAFSGNNLTGVVLPSNLETIENYAFQNNQIAGLTIPGNVTSIGSAAFRSNPLNTITSLATVPPSVITDNNGNDSFHVNNFVRSATDLYIPAGTTGAYVTDAGALWTGFNTVTENLNVGDTYVHNHITYQVISVANSTARAFDYNTAGGTVVNIPATVPNGLITYNIIEIGNYAFDYLNLTDVTLPNSIVSIGENAFFNNDLVAITIPDNVLNISDGAFANNSLTSVVIGNNVTSIGEYAFRFNSIASLTIPDSVLDIEELAFDSNVIANLNLGNGVQTIGNLAFRFNPGLQSVTIPASVTSIGEGAFATPTLTEVIALGATPPSIITSGTTTDTFSTDRSNIHLYIPVGAMGAYVTDAGALWTGFNPVTEGALGVSDFELVNDVKVISTLNQIEIKHPESIQLHSFNIYSISGNKVMEGNENTFTTEALSKGIYIIELNFDKGRMAKKFVK